MIEPTLLADLIAYDPDTGVLTWKPRPNSPHFRLAGKVCSQRIHKDGGRQITLGDQPYRINRVAFAIMTGRWPQRIRNLSGDPTDNRWVNLYEITGEHKADVKAKREARYREDAETRAALLAQARVEKREAKANAHAQVMADRAASRAAIREATADERQERKREANRRAMRLKRQRHPEKKRAQRSLERARKRNAADPTADPQKIAAVYALRQRMEEITGHRYHVDHLIPLAKGGRHHEDNLVVMSGPLNEAKSDHIIPGLIAFFSREAK